MRHPSSDGTGYLGIRDPGLVDLLCDPVAIAVWGALRSARAVCGRSEIERTVPHPAVQVQAALDRMVAAGLASMRRARGRRSTVGYEARFRSIVIAYDPACDEMLAERVRGSMRGPADGSEVPRRAAGRFLATAPVDHAALQELHRRIMDVIGYVRSLGMVTTRLDGDVRGATAALPICVVIDLAPLSCTEHGHSAVTLLPAAAADRASLPVGARSAGRVGLTRREWDIAAALAAGCSRPEVAQRMGISLNTVATISRSVYRKLGVHSRIQLAATISGSPVGHRDADAGNDRIDRPIG